MWIISLILLSVVFLSKEQVGACKNGVWECELKGNHPPDFPKTIKEFNETCQTISDYMKCVLDSEIRCNGINKNSVIYLTKLYKHFNDICKEDRFLRKEIGNSINCLGPAIEKKSVTCNGVLPLTEEDVLIGQKQEADEYEEGIFNKHYSRAICRRPIWRLTCLFQNMIAHCNKPAANVAMEAIEELEILSDVCSDIFLLKVNLLLPDIKNGNASNSNSKDDVTFATTHSSRLYAEYDEGN